jgi:hypothetical protein
VSFLFFMGAIAANALWTFVRRPVCLLIAGVIASRPLDFYLIPLAASLLISYSWCSFTSSAIGYQLSRLRQCRLSFNRLNGHVGDFIVTNRADKILEKFAVEFLPEARAKGQANALYTTRESEPNIVFVRPTSSNKRDRLLPPQAYPDFLEESLIVASVPSTTFKNDPFLVFLLLHEIEHCTVPAFVREAQPYQAKILILVTACGVLLSVRADMLATLCCVLYFSMLFIEAHIFKPAQLEAETDLRALARLDGKDFEAVVGIRDREFREKLSKRDSPLFKRYFRPGALAMYMQSSILAALNESWASPDRWFKDTNAKRRAVEALGYGSAFGTLISFPAAALIYLAATRTEDVTWIGSLIYLVAASLFYVAQVIISTKAEAFYKKRKAITEQMAKD